MKQLNAFLACLLIAGASYGQKGTNTAVKKANPNKSGVSGTILDMRKRPVEGVKAFIYVKDSIVSSGYTDDAGNFETGFTLPGIYDLKLVYPSDKVMVVTGIPVKRKTLTVLNMRVTPPVADTALTYTMLMPPPTVAKNPRT